MQRIDKSFYNFPTRLTLQVLALGKHAIDVATLTLRAFRFSRGWETNAAAFLFSWIFMNYSERQ
jgi:hypothetical protein